MQSLSHSKAKWKNIPTVQHQAFMTEEQQKLIQKTYPHLHSNYSQAFQEVFKRHNHNLDHQLIWKGKETTSPVKLTTQSPPLYIQEKVQPKVIINNLLRQSRQIQAQNEHQVDLFTCSTTCPMRTPALSFINAKLTGVTCRQKREISRSAAWE